MSTTELNLKLTDLQELKRMKEELEAEIAAIEDGIKAHMTAEGIDTFTAGAFKVSWKEVTSSRLDTTALKKAFPAETLQPYMKTTTNKRFTIN